MAENTFLGLQPYTEADAYRFKGRTDESQELFRLIVRNDYTVCYAESGEGKTSLLNAGVFPLLRENMFFPIEITFTSDDYQRTPDNFDPIIDRCIKDSISDYNEKNKGLHIKYELCSTDFQNTDSRLALQKELSKYSWWKLRNYKPQAMGLTFTPVFVFDQFEEVFNLPGSIVWTKKFFDWLEDVSSNSCPEEIVSKVREIIGTNAAFPAIKEEKDFKAVFSLRKEFIGELDYWGMQKCFIPSLKDNRYCLKALTYEGAKNVMAQQQRFAEDKVEQVLHYFVKQYSREPEKTISENLPVIPALLLSVVCDSWEKDLDFFSGKDVNEIGQSLNLILERFYDEALFSITKELSRQEGNGQTDAIRGDIDNAIFALVDGNGKRVRRKSSELSHLAFDAKYKEILRDNRIIKISKVDGEDYVEIVHDALCPIIAKRKELYLATEAKRREEEKLRQKNRKRNKRIISFSIGLFLLLSICAAIFLFWQNKKMSELNNDMLQYQSRALAMKSIELFEEGDTCTACLLALYACPEKLDAPNRPYTAEAELAIRTFTQDKGKVLLGHNGGVNYVSFSSDDNYLISSSEDGGIIIWNVPTGEMLHKLFGHTRRVNTAHFSSDGKSIVSASDDGKIIVWDFASGNQKQIINCGDSPIKEAIFSTDEKYILYYTNNGLVHVWNIEKMHEEREIGKSNVKISNMTLLDDVNLLIADSENYSLWNVITGELIGEIHNTNGITTSAFLDNSGEVLALSVLNKTIYFSYGFIVMEENSGHTDTINCAKFFVGSEGLLCVSASNDCTVRVCRITDDWSNSLQNELIALFEEHSGSVKYATFNHKGNMVASASKDGTVRIWRYETFQSLIEKTKIKYEGKELTTADKQKYIMNRSQR